MVREPTRVELDWESILPDDGDVHRPAERASTEVRPALAPRVDWASRIAPLAVSAGLLLAALVSQS